MVAHAENLNKWRGCAAKSKDYGKTVKAINCFGLKDMRLVDVPDPVPGKERVLVAVKACGICGSDKWQWWSPVPSTKIEGHEIAGEVVALGPGVKQLRVGDPVAIHNAVTCGTCPACQAGDLVRCPDWDGRNDVNGGYAELVVAPERNCLKLDAGIDFETGCLILDNWGTPFSAIGKTDIKRGDYVVVSGCGPIGLGAVGVAKLRGASVIAVDPVPRRLKIATQLGAEVGFPPNEELPNAIRKCTSGLGAHFVVECSGKGAAYPLALASLRIGGTLISVGEHAEFNFHPSELLIRRHLTIIGSWYSTMKDGRQVQDLIKQKKIMPKQLVTHRAPLAEFPQIFKEACEEPEKVIKAVILNP